MNARALAAGSLVVAAAAVALLALRRGPEAAASRPAAAPAAARCDFDGARELGYRVTLRTDVEGNGTPGGEVRASLRLRPLRAHADRSWTLSGRFTPDGHTPEEARLDAPFAVRVSRLCRFEEFAWPAGTARPQAEAIRATLGAFEFRAPDAPGAAWESTHRDATGPFIARYRRLDEAHPLVAEAVADGYLNAAPDAAERLAAWSVRAAFDARGHWLSHAEGRARYAFGSAVRAFEVRSRWSLDVDTPRGNAPALSIDELAWGMPPEPVAPSPAAATLAAPAAAATLAALGVADAYAQVLALFDGDRDPAHEAAFQRLRQWLLARPTAASELLGWIRARNADPRLHALLFMTLGETDTPEGRRALIAALTDRAFEPMDRQRASAALGAMRTPTREALDALRTASREGGASTDDALCRGVAMRSLGAIASDRSPAALADEARTTLREAIESRDGDVRLAGLDAAGNAGTVALLPALRSGLDDASAPAREAAAHALRAMPTEVAQPILTARLRAEPDATVRRSVAETLTANAHGRYAPETVDAAAALLPGARDPSVRGALLRLLGDASGSVPSARRALIAWLPREPEVALVQVIGTFLTVDEMRAAIALRRQPTT